MIRSVDVTGLGEVTIAAVEQIVSELRARSSGGSGVPSPFVSREEWRKAIREWASSHSVGKTSADWSRESVYAGCGE